MIPIRDVNPSQSKPVVTVALIVVNSLIWIYEWSLKDTPGMFEIFIREFGLVPVRIFDAPYTFITHMFLHGGWFHIISNMWILWIFGDNVEDVMGKFKFIVFFVLCGFGAALLQIVISLLLGGGNTPMVGASGAISGVLAAYMKFFPAARVLTLLPVFFFITFVEVPAFFFIGLWFLGQIINGILTLPFVGFGGVAWWAHIGGFLTGLFLAEKFISKERILVRIRRRYYR